MDTAIRENGIEWPVPERVVRTMQDQGVLYECDGREGGEPNDHCGAGIFHVDGNWLAEWGAAWERALEALIASVAAEAYLREHDTLDALAGLDEAQKALVGKRGE